jgi:hypothetical protein
MSIVQFADWSRLIKSINRIGHCYLVFSMMNLPNHEFADLSQLIKFINRIDCYFYK